MDDTMNIEYLRLLQQESTNSSEVSEETIAMPTHQLTGTSIFYDRERGQAQTKRASTTGVQAVSQVPKVLDTSRWSKEKRATNKLSPSQIKSGPRVHKHETTALNHGPRIHKHQTKMPSVMIQPLSGSVRRTLLENWRSEDMDRTTAEDKGEGERHPAQTGHDRKASKVGPIIRLIAPKLPVEVRKCSSHGLDLGAMIKVSGWAAARKAGLLQPKGDLKSKYWANNHANRRFGG